MGPTILSFLTFPYGAYYTYIYIYAAAVRPLSQSVGTRFYLLAPYVIVEFVFWYRIRADDWVMTILDGPGSGYDPGRQHLYSFSPDIDCRQFNFKWNGNENILIEFFDVEFIYRQTCSSSWKYCSDIIAESPVNDLNAVRHFIHVCIMYM